MYNWIIIILSLLFIEITRYIRYMTAYSILNNDQPVRDTNYNNNKIMIQDIKKNLTIIENLLTDIYFSKQKLENMGYEDVHNTLYELFKCDKNTEYKNDVDTIFNNLHKKYKFRHGIFHHRLCSKPKTIKAIFPILPIYIITRSIWLLVIGYMKIIGYRYYILDNGLKIWYSPYDEKKGTPIVFFHPSVGGLSFQYTLLRHFHNTHNIILPEIPGISFMDSHDVPLKISDIVESTHKFITEYYTPNELKDGSHYKVNKINLMGNSLGCSICGAYINAYPLSIDNFFCIEGLIFYPRALHIFESFEKNLTDIPLAEIPYIPLFHRELYVQYFMYKRLNLDHISIFELNSNNNRHIKIHMYHVMNDDKILIKPQLEYARFKKIPLKYHIFDGNFNHGSFFLSNEFKNYVIDDIQKIYDMQKIEKQITNI